MKIVKNTCYGGFNVTQEVGRKLKALGVKIVLKDEEYENGAINNLDNIYLVNEEFDIISDNSHAYRSDKRLIQVIEKIGIENASNNSKLIIVEIPDDVEWEIDNYDGIETIHEKHRCW